MPDTETDPFSIMWAKVTAALDPIADRITLKKYREVKERSCETRYFSAEVWFDGAKVGGTHNDGLGGETNVWFATGTAGDVIPGMVRNALIAGGSDPAKFGVSDLIDICASREAASRWLKKLVTRAHKNGYIVAMCKSGQAYSNPDLAKLLADVKLAGETVTSLHVPGRKAEVVK